MLLLAALTTDFLHIRFLDVIDILLVALLVYEVYNLLKGTAAINIMLGIAAIFILWRVVKFFEMELLSEILGAFISVGFIALIVVFQPEIRRFLLLLGTPTFIRRNGHRFLFWKFSYRAAPAEIDPIIQACRRMSLAKTGALIAMAQHNQLEEFTDTGELIDSRVSSQLIENIFFKNSPLHDGALIIVDNRMKAAGCILPVSANPDLPSNVGLRHRAAVGLTERTDAFTIIVSEQTGKISYSLKGVLYPNVEPAQLKQVLEAGFRYNEKA